MLAKQGLPVALAYDDVLLEPGPSDIVPADVSVSTALGGRRGMLLDIPLLSAAMDTVTESRMAIEIAKLGGLGVVHRNLAPEKQAAEVSRVKRFESGIVSEPLYVSPEMTVGEVLTLKSETGYSGLPVVEEGTVVGIVTNRDLRFERDHSRKICEVMTPRGRLVTVPTSSSLENAKRLMREHRIERVIVEDGKKRLRGLITVKDIVLSEQHPDASKDSAGRLRVAAAVGVDDQKRAQVLVEAGADALVVDTAHGHSRKVGDTVRSLRRKFPGLMLIAGNIATAAAAAALAKAGADAVKVGIGPGSICTTRIVSGVGVPQLSAVSNVAAGLRGLAKRPGIIADGGVRYSGDIAKALAAGADAVMIGGMFAGTEEAPGETELYRGRAYKSYRGMGSVGALKSGGAQRYFQDAAAAVEKLVPEGVEGRVPYKGGVDAVIGQMVGGLRAAMGYVGAKNVAELKRKGRFLQITQAGSRESHIHDVQITKEAPNYPAG